MPRFQKNQYSFLLLALLGLATLQACSTDVELNAPYQERAVIWGAIDITAPEQTIRIQRSFLTIEEPDLAVAARRKDSIYYAAPGDDLEVVLYEELNTGTPRRIGLLQRVEGNDKDSGFFYYPDYLAYRFQGSITGKDSADLRQELASFGNQNSTARRRRIRLEVTNKRTGYKAIARTRVVYPIFDDDFNNINSQDRYRLLEPARFGGQRIFQTFRPEIAFGAHANGVVFKAIVNIRWQDVLQDGTTFTDSTNWTILPETYASNNQRELRRRYTDRTEEFVFFNILASAVNRNRNVAYRRLLPLKIDVYAGDSSLANYVQVSNNFSAITQTRPTFTNVENGLGLLYSRQKKTFVANTDSITNQTYFNSAQYQDLRFRN